MNFKTLTALPLLAPLLGGCATTTPDIQADVFSDPAGFLGQQVEVCGRLSGTSNILSPLDRSQGLAILTGEEDAPFILERARENLPACLIGKVEYLGCRTGEVTCVDWDFDYAIRVAQIR